MFPGGCIYRNSTSSRSSKILSLCLENEKLNGVGDSTLTPEGTEKSNLEAINYISNKENVGYFRKNFQFACRMQGTNVEHMQDTQLGCRNKWMV